MADVTEGEQTQRLSEKAWDFAQQRSGLVPIPGFCHAHHGGRAPGEVQQQCHGMIRYLLDEYVGYVGDDDTGIGSRFDVDHVDTHATDPDDHTLLQGIDHLLVDAQTPTRNDGIDIGDSSGKFGRCVCSDFDDIGDGCERFQFECPALLDGLVLGLLGKLDANFFLRHLCIDREVLIASTSVTQVLHAVEERCGAWYKRADEKMDTKSMSGVRLETTDIEVEIDPDRGGSLQAFKVCVDGEWRGLMKQGDQHLPASFAMVPFASRIRDGELNFAGELVRVQPNVQGEAHPLHGYGWLRPWSIVEQSPTHLVMEHGYRPEAFADEMQRRDWPFSYTARQRIEVASRSLSVYLVLENTGERTMPSSIGLHPLFSLTPKARLRANIGGVWRMDAEAFPLELGEDFLALADGLSVADTELDHVCSGWRGTAHVEWPEWGVALDMVSDELPELIVWTPREESYFGFEPISHVPGEMKSLKPGALHTARVQFHVREQTYAD